jgi:hypothetical protein
MDPSTSEDQNEVARTLVALIRRYRGDERFPRSGEMESATLSALLAGGYLDRDPEAGLIGAALIVECCASQQLLAPVSARLLVGPALGQSDLPVSIGLMNRPGGALVRYGADCDLFIAIDGDDVILADRGSCEIEAVKSRYRYPYARCSVRGGDRLASSSGSIRSAWQLAIAVELSGLMIAAVEHTARYVSTREQFGRPIGSLQAVQQRLASAYVLAEGARWLSRRAACSQDDPYLMASAAAFACFAAQSVYTHVHQVSGGMGITVEHGLVGWTMPLLGLSQELGGFRAHARDVTAWRNASPTALFGHAMSNAISGLDTAASSLGI